MIGEPGKFTPQQTLGTYRQDIITSLVANTAADPLQERFANVVYDVAEGAQAVDESLTAKRVLGSVAALAGVVGTNSMIAPASAERTQSSSLQTRITNMNNRCQYQLTVNAFVGGSRESSPKIKFGHMTVKPVEIKGDTHLRFRWDKIARGRKFCGIVAINGNGDARLPKPNKLTSRGGYYDDPEPYYIDPNHKLKNTETATGTFKALYK